MDYKIFNNTCVLRIDKDEDLVESIFQVAKKEKIKLGSISGMGAINHSKLSIYDVSKKEYSVKEFSGEMEIVSLEGNISSKENEPIIHLHMALAQEDCSVYGGHLHSANISVTAEIFINIIDGELEKKFDEDTGANLLTF